MELIDMLKIEYWHLGIIEFKNSDKSLEEILKNNRIQWLKYKYKDRFFADPFLFNATDNVYNILAEEYLHDERKGKIVLLEVDKRKKNIRNRKIFLEEKTHLSFPFLYNGKLYVENYRSNNYYNYQLKDMSITGKKLEFNQPCIDPIIYNHCGVEYLFTSLPDNPFGYERLFYKENGHWIEHPKSPIESNKKYSRMAGNIFMNEERLIRPVQDCKNSYGNQLHFMQITKLTKDEFEEKKILSLSTQNESKYNMGIHTFNMYDNFILVDGYSYRVHPIRRIITTLKRRGLKR